MAKTGDSEQFSITLPMDAIEMIEEGLIPFGLYGKKRHDLQHADIGHAQTGRRAGTHPRGPGEEETIRLARNLPNEVLS